jgi:HAD superfamily hydrolase (TIGR01509 family)
VSAAAAGVVFDNDGLTLDSEIVWTRAEVVLFARRGRTFTHEHKLALVGNAGPVAAAKLEAMLEAPAGTGAAILAELNDLVEIELERGCEPMPGARELLAALRAERRPIALCSNSPRRLVDAALRSAGMAEVFDVVVGGDDVPRGKPAPDPYLAAVAGLGLAPAACTALEDSPTGVASAKAAGLRVLGVPSVPGVDLAGLADAVHPSLEDPRLWAALGLGQASAGAGADAGAGPAAG